MDNKYNIVVGQSGGPTTVINASLYGVIKEAVAAGDKIGKVYGMINGIEGFINGSFMDIKQEMSEREIELLKSTPSSYLGSCRYKLPDSMEDSMYRQIFEQFAKLDIRYFIYIGGNDSMDTVSKLSIYAKKTNSPVKIIGVPKTIDNDLVLTDHSPGFGSAAKYVATTVRDIVMDASVYDMQSVTIVELMGRHAGWITASSILARKFEGDNPYLIYLPEVAFDVEAFINKITELLQTKTNIVVCVSEGIKDKDGTFICEYSGCAGVDTFGHKMLTGCGKYLENVIKEHIGVKVRSIELNVNQRCKAALASKTDVDEAVMAGRFGVKALLSGETGCMVAFERIPGDGYKVKCNLVDCSRVCNKEKTVPIEWISDSGTDILNEFTEYAKPLIMGENEQVMEDGLPVYVYRKG